MLRKVKHLAGVPAVPSPASLRGTNLGWAGCAGTGRVAGSHGFLGGGDVRDGVGGGSAFLAAGVGGRWGWRGREGAWHQPPPEPLLAASFWGHLVRKWRHLVAREETVGKAGSGWLPGGVPSAPSGTNQQCGLSPVWALGDHSCHSVLSPWGPRASALRVGGMTESWQGLARGGVGAAAPT